MPASKHKRELGTAFRLDRFQVKLDLPFYLSCRDTKITLLLRH